MTNLKVMNMCVFRVDINYMEGCYVIIFILFGSNKCE